MQARGRYNREQSQQSSSPHPNGGGRSLGPDAHGDRLIPCLLQQWTEPEPLSVPNNWGHQRSGTNHIWRFNRSAMVLLCSNAVKAVEAIEAVDASYN
jgi:hypothetical protein